MKHIQKCTNQILFYVQITATSKEQWKLLLEQNSIGYIFPDEIPKLSPDGQTQNNVQADTSGTRSRSTEQDWQFVIPVPSPNQSTDEKPDAELSEFEMMKDGFVSVNSDQETNGSTSTDLMPASGIFPAARARLASLRDLGAKKIGALKLKLIENKIKSNERGE